MTNIRHIDSLVQSYPAVPESVGPARRALVRFARAAGADDRGIEALRLAASEAITNAVRHAYDGEAGLVHVTAAMAGAELWVLIADDGSGLRAGSPHTGLGIGLALIASVTDHVAIVKRASGGTEVRMRFALHADDLGDQARGSVSAARRAA